MESAVFMRVCIGYATVLYSMPCGVYSFRYMQAQAHAPRIYAHARAWTPRKIIYKIIYYFEGLTIRYAMRYTCIVNDEISYTMPPHDARHAAYCGARLADCLVRKTPPHGIAACSTLIYPQYARDCRRASSTESISNSTPHDALARYTQERARYTHFARRAEQINHIVYRLQAARLFYLH